MRRRFLIVGSSLLLALLVPACFRSRGLGRSVTLLIASDVLSLDPNRQLESVSDSVLLNVFEPLVARGADLQTKTALADRWEHPSPERWRFHLRKGVKFHDGSALTAGAARDALLRVKGDPALETSSFLEQVVRIEAVGDDVLDLVTREPRALLPSLLSIYIAKRNTAGTFPPFLGTGPYRLVEWTPGRQVVLQGWSEYWGARPWIEKAVFLPVSDARERLSRLQKGEADIAYAPPSALAVGPAPNGIRIVRGPGLTVYYLAFNVRDTPGNPFRDVRVRRAFHLALNRQELVSSAMRGIATVATQPVSPLVFGYNTRIPAPPFDPARARALLAEAGWGKGLKVRLDLPESRLPTGRALRQALAAVGVEVALNPLAGNAVYELAGSGKSDFFFAGWDCTSGEASEFYEFNLRTPSERSGRGNYGAFSNRRLDELAERNAAALEATQRKALLEEAAAIVMDALPILPLYIEDNLFAVRRGVVLSPPADGEIRLAVLGGESR